MVKLRSFKGHLANKEFAQQVLSPPNDTLDTNEAKQMAEGNPMSFLHVVKPEIAMPTLENPYAKEVYQQGYDALQHFIEKKYIEQDEEKRIYIYKMQMGDHVQHGILGLTSIEDYEQNLIKKHEFTLKKKLEDRTCLIDTQNANAEPVFFTFKGHDYVKEKIAQIVSTQQEYALVDSQDGVIHTLWLCSGEDSEFFVEAFDNIPELFVADGHHRTQAAYNVGKKRRDQAIAEGKQVTGEEEFNFFMALIIPDSDLMIMDYNRVLKTLNGMSTQEFLQSISKNYDIKPIQKQGEDIKNITPTSKHNLSLLIDNVWYSLDLKKEQYDNSTPLTHLDAQMLSELVLSPILGITDLKKDQRIDFVGGIRGLQELERRCSEDCVAAFALYPITMQEIMDVAEAGLIMPPKSTWFEPKPRSGFVVRCFEQDQTKEQMQQGYRFPEPRL